MNPEPISKALYEKAKSMGITKIELEFQGGSDEGYLNIGLHNKESSDDRGKCRRISIATGY
jgi:hypothetical protein